MPSVPRKKYPEMDWRAADKVTTWKLFKWQMKVIFMADQVPEERQYALILVAGGDEAYNHWDTLEEMVDNPKKVDQVWDAFEKSFKQSTSFWHLGMLTWPTSDKTHRRQQLISISASSRQSGGANRRKKLRRSE